MVAYCMLAVMYLFPILSACLLKRNRDRLETKEFEDKFINLYANVHLKRSSWAIFYLPVFLTRRCLHFLLPVIIYFYPYFQLQLSLLLAVFYLIWYGSVKPHNTRFTVRLELFNEFCVIMMLYHMFLFTNFNLSETLKYYMGYTCVGTIALMLVVNVSFLV